MYFSCRTEKIPHRFCYSVQSQNSKVSTVTVK